MEKENILAEVRRTAQQNGGKPLGKARFEQATGILTSYWSRFSDLQREAGFEPNQLNGAYNHQYLFEKIIELTRELKRFPTNNEKRNKTYNDPSFPSATVFDRLGTKDQLVSKVLTYCLNRPEYQDVVRILEPIVSITDSARITELASERFGEVYLIKSGKYYKIGMTKDIVRRGGELKIQLPERTDLIHSIKTDDPSGIEAYWHRRFADKRMNGEWFNLSQTDIRAFKRWRKIF